MSATLRLTTDQYDRMIEDGVFDDGRRIELIRGDLREMTPISPTHEETVDILTEWSMDHAPRDKVRVRIQNSVGLQELESVPEPDVLWVARKSYRDHRPLTNDVLLLIEVSKSSLAYDRGEKAQLYAEAGIADYWVVNLVDWCVEVHRQPTETGYRDIQTFQHDTTVSPLAFPELKLPVSLLFSQQQ